jgi:hypothetical protein
MMDDHNAMNGKDTMMKDGATMNGSGKMGAETGKMSDMDAGKMTGSDSKKL